MTTNYTIDPFKIPFVITSQAVNFIETNGKVSKEELKAHPFIYPIFMEKGQQIAEILEQYGLSENDVCYVVEDPSSGPIVEAAKENYSPLWSAAQLDKLKNDETYVKGVMLG